MKYWILNLLLMFISRCVFAQAASYSDPAQAFLRIMLERSAEGSYQQVGNFKVIGTPYLYGGSHNGNAYLKKNQFKDILLSYDTYKQMLIFNFPGNSDAVLQSVSNVDSIVINSSNTTLFKTDLKFERKTVANGSKPVFLQLVFKGNKFSLYKQYTSDLSYVSTNYIQSELRQFNLNVEYFYERVPSAGVLKLKTSPSYLKKEFKTYRLDHIVDDQFFTLELEENMKKLFQFLNG